MRGEAPTSSFNHFLNFFSSWFVAFSLFLKEYLFVVICLTKVHVGGTLTLWNNNQPSEQVTCSGLQPPEPEGLRACDLSILLGGLAVLAPENISGSVSVEEELVSCFCCWEMVSAGRSKQGCANHLPVSVKHHRPDWQLHQLQLRGHGALCSSGKAGASAWAEVQIQVHNHSRLRADPSHHWKRRLREYGCSSQVLTVKVKLFQTVLRSLGVTNGNLLNLSSCIARGAVTDIATSLGLLCPWLLQLPRQCFDLRCLSTRLLIEQFGMWANLCV